MLLERLPRAAKAGAKSAVNRREPDQLDPAAVVAAQPWFSDGKGLVVGATSGGKEPPRSGYKIGAWLAGQELERVATGAGCRASGCDCTCTALRPCKHTCTHSSADAVTLLLRVCHLLLWPHMLQHAAGAHRPAAPWLPPCLLHAAGGPVCRRLTCRSRPCLPACLLRAGEPSCISQQFLQGWYAFLVALQKNIRSMQPEDQGAKVGGRRQGGMAHCTAARWCERHGIASPTAPTPPCLQALAVLYENETRNLIAEGAAPMSP